MPFSLILLQCKQPKIMHKLIEVSDISRVHNGTPTTHGSAVWTDGIHFHPEIAKFRGRELAEIYGYLLAQHIGLRTCRMQGFNCPCSGWIDGRRLYANRIGLLIEAIGSPGEVRHVSWEVAEHQQVAKTLILQVFGAGDGIEILATSMGPPFFVDLELACHFGGIIEADVVGRNLEGYLGEKLPPDDSMVEGAHARAVELGVEKFWLDAAKDLIGAKPPSLDISGHPDQEILNEIAKRKLRSLLDGLEQWLIKRRY